MKIFKTILALGLLASPCIPALAKKPSVALPAVITSYLDQNHAGWKLVEGDPVCKSHAVVKGDLDGNGKTDYAVMFKTRKDGYITAFLANGATYKPVAVHQGYVGDGGFLVLAKKGEPYAEIISEDGERGPTRKLKTDALASGGCESSETLYIYANGKFSQIATSE